MLLARGGSMNSGKLWTSVHDVNQLQMHTVIVMVLLVQYSAFRISFRQGGVEEAFQEGDP